MDEAHNLAPSHFGNDSELSKMLGRISPLFEHRLFLSATPHNGFTRSFSGLLEMLDPVRFTRTTEFTDDERRRVEQVVIRRLKSEINERTEPSRFCDRDLDERPLSFSPQELVLAECFQAFRKKVKSEIAARRRSEQLIGSFAIEILNKRLLSGPYTFAESWSRYLEGMGHSEAAENAEVNAARHAAEEDLDDDLEAEGRRSHAIRTVGAWLIPIKDKLEEEMTDLNDALMGLGIDATADSTTIPNPSHDARWDALIKVLEQRLMADGKLRDDERIVIFTEYKTTLDYFERRLKDRFPDEGVVRVLYGGGMGDDERDDLKSAFNDPEDPIRILVATDAASEGLNLQETARYLMHWDVPWNPARLEQRNGRLDRHGQARDVTVFHFTCADNADLRFLAHVVNKVHQIREDLGSMEDVFNAAMMERFHDLEDAEDVQDRLDSTIEYQKGKTEIPRNTDAIVGQKHMESLETFKREIDLTPDTLKDTLKVALRPIQLEGPDDKECFRLSDTRHHRWELLINDELRIKRPGGIKGPLPRIVFDPEHFIQWINKRPIFRPSKDTRIVHLGHLIYQHALTMIAKSRFEGTEESANRWIVKHGDVPKGADALVLLTVEELAVNELREPFHHWTRTIRFPVKKGKLGDPLPHIAPVDDHPASNDANDKAKSAAADLWMDIDDDLKDFLRNHAATLTTKITTILDQEKTDALKDQQGVFKERLKEIEPRMKGNTLSALEKEINKVLDKISKGILFKEMLRDAEQQVQDKQAELELRTNHYQELKARLEIDRDRTINELIPRRYQLRDQVRVFPVAVEIRLPGGKP